MKMTARLGRRGVAAQVSGGADAERTGGSATSQRIAVAPLFAGLSPAHAAAATACFEEAHYMAGHRMVVEGLRGRDFYVILAGRAAVLAGDVRVTELGPGDVFGEIAALSDGTRPASVMAETPLHCLVLADGRLDQLLLDHPQVGVNLLHSLVERYRQVAWSPRSAAATVGRN